MYDSEGEKSRVLKVAITRYLAMLKAQMLYLWNKPLDHHYHLALRKQCHLKREDK